jgi:hypothetical protein
LEYPYTKKDLLQHPQKYQHSIFEGKSFIFSYLNLRKKINKKIKNNTTIVSVSDTVNSLSSLNHTTAITKTNSFVTEEFLTNFLKNNKIKENEIQILEKLLKIFEINKKIYSSYNFKLNEHSNDFSLLRNYVLFSLICIKLFQMNENLKYLNTILKLNDIICSKINSVVDNNDLSLIYNTIKFEIQQIEKLLKNNSVRL